MGQSSDLGMRVQAILILFRCPWSSSLPFLVKYRVTRDVGMARHGTALSAGPRKEIKVKGKQHLKEFLGITVELIKTLSLVREKGRIEAR